MSTSITSSAPVHRYLFAQDCEDGMFHISLTNVECGDAKVNIKLSANNAAQLAEAIVRGLARLLERQRINCTCDAVPE